MKARKAFFTIRAARQLGNSSRVFDLKSEPIKACGHPPNSRILWAYLWKLWKDLWRPNRLRELQNELVEFSFPLHERENLNIFGGTGTIPIDGNGNHINEVYFDVNNGSGEPRKHIVFMHGYGAALGLWSRNFAVLRKLHNTPHDYRVHFLDNITVGLSSNPRAKLPHSNSIWPKCCPEPRLVQASQESQVRHNKYYRLVDSYSLDDGEVKRYRQHYKPILEDIESLYTLAIEGWRISSGIEKIDHLLGHSFGGYWCALYAMKHPDRVGQLILILPVGVERHVHAITSTTSVDHKLQSLKPSLDPMLYDFLTRWPDLLPKFKFLWYYLLSFMPRLLRVAGGPWGVRHYFKLWIPKLAKVNRVKSNIQAQDTTSLEDRVVGSDHECDLLAKYLYSAITTGSNSDRYIKQVLTPATVAKWPLIDKFAAARTIPFPVHCLYGQFDFMNGEAGSKMVEMLQCRGIQSSIEFVSQGGHNLSIDNPFETNSKIAELILARDGGDC